MLCFIGSRAGKELKETEMEKSPSRVTEDESPGSRSRSRMPPSSDSGNAERERDGGRRDRQMPKRFGFRLRHSTTRDLSTTQFAIMDDVSAQMASTKGGGGGGGGGCG